MPHLEERLSAWGLLASPFDKRILIGGEWGRGSHGAISIAAASRGAQAPGSSGSAGASVVWSLCRVWSEAGPCSSSGFSAHQLDDWLLRGVYLVE